MRWCQVGYQRWKDCKGGGHLHTKPVVGRSRRQPGSSGVPGRRVGTLSKSGEGQSRSIVGIVEYQDPSM